MVIFYGNPRKLIHQPTVGAPCGSKGVEGSLARWVVLPSWGSWSGSLSCPAGTTQDIPTSPRHQLGLSPTPVSTRTFGYTYLAGEGCVEFLEDWLKDQMGPSMCEILGKRV